MLCWFSFLAALIYTTSQGICENLSLDQIQNAKFYSTLTYQLCPADATHCADTVVIRDKSYSLDRFSLPPSMLKQTKIQTEAQGVLVTQESEGDSPKLVFKNIVCSMGELQVCDKFSLAKIGCADYLKLVDEKTVADLGRVNLKEKLKRNGTHDVFVCGHYTSGDGYPPAPAETQHVFHVASIEPIDKNRLPTDVDDSSRRKNKQEKTISPSATKTSSSDPK